MTKFKKALCLLLCAVMVLGTVTVAGIAFVPKSSAAEGTSKVKSASELTSQFSADTSKPFVYLGADYYEADGKLTDYYVKSGDTIDAYLFIKSNMYVGYINYAIEYDRTFFDLKMRDAAAGEDETVSVSRSGADFDKFITVKDVKNSGGTALGYGTDSMKIVTLPAKSNMKTIYSEVADDFDKYDVMQIVPAKPVATTSAQMLGDDYFLKFTITVKQGLADKTTGFIGAQDYLYSACSAKNAAKRVSIKCAPTEGGTQSATLAKAGITVDGGNFLCEDTQATFTIGTNPNEGQGGSTEGTSKVKSASTLTTQFSADTSKPFVYLGADYYEADGKLTDYYVKSGDTIDAYLFIKSNMYVGYINYAIEYDRTFFDLNMRDAAAGEDETVSVSRSGADFDKFITVKDVKNSGGTALGYGTDSMKIVTLPAKSNMKTIYSEVADDFDTYDVMQIVPAKPVATTSAQMLGDDYFLKFTITVKQGLADGKTGFIGAQDYLYSACSAKNAAKRVSIKCATTEGGTQFATLTKAEITVDGGNFLCEDTQATFTIGTNPGGGTTTTSYEALFVDNDGSKEISKATYKNGEDIAAPDMSASETFIGWATASGSVIEAAKFAEKMGSANVVYTAVYSTDKFDVTIDFDGGKVDGETSVTIKAAYGETVDLSGYEPKKDGYKQTGWNPATFKLENVKNVATIKPVWTAETYNYKFYIDKNDAEPCAFGQIAYGSTLSITAPTKEGYNFAGWKDKADDSTVSSNARFAAKYQFASDKEFYAVWTQMDSSYSFMAYDYSTSQWKEFKKVYGNVGTTLSKTKINDTAKLLTAADIGWDGEIKLGTTYQDETGAALNINSGLAFNGNKVIRVQAKLVYEFTVKIPGVVDPIVKSVTAAAYNSAEATQRVMTNEYAAPSGYEFVEWQFEGDPAAYTIDSTGTKFTFNYALGSKITATAVYDLKRYDVRFYIGDSANSIAVSVLGAQLGREIKLDADYVLSGTQTPIVLPVVGNEGVDFGKSGYDFAGFYFKTDSSKTIQTFPLVLTQELFDTYYSSSTGTIDFWYKWDAKEYDATFKYQTNEGEKSFVISGVPVGSDFSTFEPAVKYSDEFSMTYGDYVKANAPTGSVFTGWVTEIATSDKNMLVGGRTYIATYAKNSCKIYIDLNRGGELTDDLVSKFISNYGDDIEAPGDEMGVGIGNGAKIRNMTFIDAEKPSPECEYVGWTVYHLIDESKGVYDRSNWAEGINGSGTTNIEGTVIYQPEWKLYKDMFFRVYGNGGGDDLYCGLGKNFKMYYWKNHRPCKAGDDVLNKTSDLNLILGFLPKLENFDIKRFFDASMWQHVYLRFDPISVPKAMFTWEGISGLVSAAFTAIKTLIKGE